MDPPTRLKYDKFKEDMVIEVRDNTITAVTAAVLVNKLLQFTSGVLYKEDGTWEHIHNTKMDYLEDLLEDGTPSLIFYHYKSSLEALKTRFPDAEVLSDQSILKWREGRLKLILVHPQSGGVGINLQNNHWHTTNVVFYDLPWSSELYQQGIKRVHRQGQEKPVIVHRLLMNKSADEQVVKSLESKISVQELVLDALKYI
jgi:SNF2 family DNA or RNA helicase